jgi:hypothetical protein
MPHSVKREPLPLELVLSDEQLIALGTITAQWAYLESEIAQLTELTARTHKRPIPERMDDFSFKAKMSAWRHVVREIEISDVERAVILNLANRIADIQKERHEAIHARWGLEHDGQLVAFGDRGRIFARLMSTPTLWAIARKISELNVELGALAIPAAKATQ